MGNDYIQPKFYHFSEDSIILAVEAANLAYKKNIDILDLGAGCGVVGLEIYNRRCDVSSMTFLELQSDFLPFLEKNIQSFSNNILVNIVHSSFIEFNSDNKFDLIVGNLPYFHTEKSRPSSDERKNICRQFRKEDFSAVLEILDKNLSVEGVGLLLIHDHFLSHIETNLKTEKIWQKKEIQIIQFCR